MLMCLNNVLLKSNRPTNLRKNSSYPLDIMLTIITHDNVYTSNVTLRNGGYITYAHGRHLHKDFG